MGIRLRQYCTEAFARRTGSCAVELLDSPAALLNDGRFVQPHRSYLINLAEVVQLATGEAQLATGARVPMPPAGLPGPPGPAGLAQPRGKGVTNPYTRLQSSWSHPVRN